MKPPIAVSGGPYSRIRCWTNLSRLHLSRASHCVKPVSALSRPAQRAVTAGSLFPQTQDLFGELTQTQRSQNTATFSRPNDVTQGRGGLRTFSNYRLGGSLAWELDFWGRFRRAVEAADARLDSSIENYDDALVVLIAETATTYVDLRTVEQRLAFARSNAEMQEESTRIASARFELGAIDSEIDAPQARSNLTRTLAGIEQLEIALRQSQNRLAVLLGMPPHDLSYLLGGPMPVPAAPEGIVVGIPAGLLWRRPDVRRAERLAAAQSAEIGFAQSSLYPRISINGNLLLEAAELETCSTPALGPVRSVPVSVGMY